MDTRTLSERDICTKFITPALRRAGWDVMSQIREEVSFTKGRIIVRGKLVSRGKAKRGPTPSIVRRRNELLGGDFFGLAGV
jgi:type I restriction enzyme, R subunit